MSKRGLGSGLGALLGDGGTADVTTSAPPPKRDLQQIPIAQIRPNPHQPRTTFAADALEELRASIAAFGVLVPVIVRERGGGYELIAGERRLRASQAAGLHACRQFVGRHCQGRKERRVFPQCTRLLGIAAKRLREPRSVFFAKTVGATRGGAVW